MKFELILTVVLSAYAAGVALLFTRWFFQMVKQWLYNRRKKLLPVEMFDSIKTLWLHNWEQLNATGDYRWLFVNKSDWERAGEIDPERIQKAFYKLHDEYTDATGVVEKMGQWRTLMVLRMEARVKLAEGDRSANNWINNYTLQIDELMKAPEDPVDQTKYRAAIEMGFKQRIDPTTTTVYEFLMKAELVKEMNKPAKSTADASD